MHRRGVFVFETNMANAMLDRIKQRFARPVREITSSAVKVRDDENVDSQISRSEMETPDSEPAVGRAEDLVKLGNQRWEESRQAFWWHREQFFRGIAAYSGKQGQTWNSTSDNMMPAAGGNTNPDEMERLCRVVTNIIQPKAELFIARTFASFPDAWAVPHTNSEKDKAAAQVGRSVISHCRQVTNLEQKLEEGALDAAISTNVYFEVGWNSHGMADFGFPQPDGSVQYKRLPGGEIHCTPLLSIDCFPDPNSSLTGNIHDGAYFIKRSVRTIEFIKEKWGVTAEGTTYDEAYVHLMRRLQYLAGDTPQGRQGDKNATDVTEVWEKPVGKGGRYPDGRYWVYSTDGTILWAGKWPYKFKERYPFVKLGVKKNTGSIWDLNFIDPLLDTQKQVNGLDTYLYSRQQGDRITEYVDDMAGVPPDDLLSPTIGRTVAYDGAALGGRPPIISQQPPPPGEFYFKRRVDLMDSADIISGIRDLNSNQITPPSSGYEREIMIEEDRTRVAPFIRRVGNATVEIYDWFLHLYEQYGCSAPRMLFIDDKDDENNPMAALTDVRILREGMCRVKLSKGSGQAKSLAAQEEFLEKFVDKAAAGANPALLKFWLQETQFIRSDATIDELLADYTVFYQQQQQQAMQLQQMQGDQAQQANQQKLQQAQALAEIDTKAESDKASLQVHGEALSQQFRSTADQANERQRMLNSITMENLKFEHNMDLATNKSLTPDVSWAFPFKPGPKMTASAAKEVGLTPDSEEVLMKVAMPPKPQPKGSSNGSSASA